ncbi:hypothetical protein COU91_01620 [Candidatus Saccharibacteria bacterium CG10_big_fil_rev_8_21_14_0_10_47_8]|nr:MAG: hypothetical protein COU91_01620 [Candidatus Saccharibacteria bacterium CG10_big_fil_rev_8_21_14_0_10_47_8]
MTERYDTTLSDPVEAVQPAAETNGRISKISRLRQKLGRSTVLPEVDSSNLLGAEDSSPGTTTGLDHGIALEPNPEAPDHVTETQELASYREELKRPTPKEQALLSGNITHEEFRAGGVKYVELDNGEAGLYWSSASGKHRRERAAYLVDRSWQFGLVPTTVIREFTGSYGIKDELSFQEYIPDATDAREIPDFESIEKFQTDLYRLWIFQYSIWHTDAHKGNVIVDDKIHAIDHAHSFAHYKDREAHRAMFTDFYGVQAPEEVIKEADSFLKDDVRQQVLLEQLKELGFWESDAEACLARMRHIATTLTTKGKIDTPEELAQYSPN